MPQTQIKNEITSGTCRACEKKTDRLMSPPLLLPPDWDAVEIHGDLCRWYIPKKAPGIYLYNLAFEGGMQYLRTYGSPNDPVCLTCFAANMHSSDWKYLVNQPNEVLIGFDPFGVMRTISWRDL
jgi:hypothetical protein